LPEKNLIKDEVIMEKNIRVHVAKNLIYIIHIILFYVTPLGPNEISKQANAHAINNSKVKSNFITLMKVRKKLTRSIL